MQYRPKLDEMERRYEELTAQMADASVISDSTQYRKVTKAQSELADIVAKYREWKSVNENLEQARAMQNDAELAEMAKDEILHLEPATGGDRAGAEDRAAAPRIPTTTRTSCSRSAPARAATKPRSSPTKSSVCTRGSPKRAAGRWRLRLPAILPSAA